MSAGPDAQVRTFRLPALAYLAVLFLAFGFAPIAFSAVGSDAAGAAVGPQTLVLLVPVLAAVFIARWATIVGPEGIVVRAAFGQRVLRWDDIRGFSVVGRSVYAVTQDGSWRLPCVHVKDLGALSKASRGRLPELADPTPKYAPERRRRR